VPIISSITSGSIAVSSIFMPGSVPAGTDIPGGHAGPVADLPRRRRSARHAQPAVLSPPCSAHRAGRAVRRVPLAYARRILEDADRGERRALEVEQGEVDVRR